MVGELIKQLNYVIKDPGFFHFFFLSSSIYWLFVPNLLPHIHKMVATTPGISLHKTIFKGRKKEMAKVAKNNSPFMLLSGPPPKSLPSSISWVTWPLLYQSLSKEIGFTP